ncbi:MAG: hypothetical protein AAFN13_12700 [Bacteroidota bacterium]
MMSGTASISSERLGAQAQAEFVEGVLCDGLVLLISRVKVGMDGAHGVQDGPLVDGRAGTRLRPHLAVELQRLGW